MVVITPNGLMFSETSFLASFFVVYKTNHSGLFSTPKDIISVKIKKERQKPLF